MLQGTGLVEIDGEGEEYFLEFIYSVRELTHVLAMRDTPSHRRLMIHHDEFIYALGPWGHDDVKTFGTTGAQRCTNFLL